MEELCDTTEELIRAGKAGEARALLEKIAPSQIPRPMLAKVAELYRRSGLVDAAIRLLVKVVRPARPLDLPASPRELCEYAIALVRAGAIVEAREILVKVGNAEPIANYYLGLTYFPEWNYAAAIPHLENFVRGSDPGDYLTVVAKANLASAYVQLREHERAEAIIAEGLVTARERGLRLLLANFLELSAMLALDRREFGKSIACLGDSAEILKASGLLDELFAQKWQVLVEAYKAPASAEALLRPVREKARQLSHWETLRDLDHHQAFLLRDPKLYHHLFHGTPHAAYRAYLRGLFSELPAPAGAYDWQIGGAGPVFDVRTAIFEGKATGVKAGQLLHRLLLELASDFYRPVRAPSLAARLFEDQFFDLATMPNRVHQLVGRLRKSLEDGGVGLVIEDTAGGYRLSSESPLTVRVGEGKPSGASLKVEKLRSALPPGSFSIKDAADALACSTSSALRIVNSGIDDGLIAREVVDKRTIYIFKRAG